MIRVLIFDLDGTVADTIHAVLEAFNRMLTNRGYPAVGLERFLDYFSGSAADYARHGMTDVKDEKTLAEATEEFDRCYADTYLHTVGFPGVPEMLYRLKKDFRLCMLSNKQEAFVHALNEKLFRSGTFEIAHGIRPGIPAKPDAAAALAIARELGVKPAECAFVGDSEIDLYTARNAGMVPVLVTWGYRTEEFLKALGAPGLLRTPEELARYLLQNRQCLKPSGEAREP